MLYQIPDQLPSLDVMLHDLGNPHACALAARLGVDERTARRWQKAGNAPRPVLLALFWLTRWGRSALDAEMTNRAAVLTQLSECQSRELSRLRNVISAQNRGAPSHWSLIQSRSAGMAPMTAAAMIAPPTTISASRVSSTGPGMKAGALIACHA